MNPPANLNFSPLYVVLNAKFALQELLFYAKKNPSDVFVLY